METASATVLSNELTGCPIIFSYLRAVVLMINLPRLMGIGLVLALLATQAQTAALAHSARESETELMKKRMQTLFPTLSS